MKSINAAILAGLSLTVGIAGLGTKARALDLHTGEKTGAYYNKFCPTIKKAAKDKNLMFDCRPSQGSLDNLDKVIANPNDFGLAQYDLFSLKYTNQSNQPAFKPIRDDLGKECLFLVTKNKLMKNFGDVVASAPYMNFILPPESSGHAGTFKYLQSIDPSGIGKAGKVTHAASTEDAITSALAQEDNVTLFVHFPNADNKLFNLVNENRGHFVPVISKEILAQETQGRKVYSAEETDVANPKWHESGKKVVTACTPMVLFTGKSDLISDPSEKAAHEKAVTALQEMPADKLRPTKGWFSKLWTNTKAVSAKGVEGLVDATEKARKASSPYLRKAKEMTQDAVDAAKPTYEKAKEKTKETLDAAKPTYEKAKEKTKEALEAAKPTYEKAKEVTKDTYEKAKELGGKAIEKVGEMMESTKKPAENTPSE